MLFEGPLPDIWEESRRLTAEEIATIKSKALQDPPDGDALWQLAALIIDGKVELTASQATNDHGISYAKELLRTSSADYYSGPAAYLLYELGKRQQMPPHTSLQWLELAASRNYGKAQAKWGHHFACEQKYDIAASWYKAGFKQGDASATLYLADYYAQGKGDLPRDPRLARKLALLVSRRNYPYGIDSLQKWLGEGLPGVTEKDVNLALHRAARHGVVPYAYQLVMKVRDAETAKAIRIPPNVAALLRHTAEKHQENRHFYDAVKILLALHRCYRFGIGGVAMDPIEAERILYEQIPACFE